MYQFNKMIIRLSELKPGQEGIIKEFNNNEIFLKLMEMGCVPGDGLAPYYSDNVVWSG